MNPNRTTFPGLSPAHFTHPADEAALKSVRDLPLINSVLKRMFQYGFEKMLRVRAMSDDIKVTRRSYATLHEMIVDVAQRLDIPQPDLFVEQHPVPNAMTTGAEYPFIVVRSGLIDLMSDDEVYCVIAHECGHIKSGHVLYLMAARFLTVMANAMGVAGLPLQGMLLALLEWSRKAEFTCDRASLLCTQDAAVVQSALMKLAGGTGRMMDQIDFEDFLRQGDMFDAMTAGISLNKFYRLLTVLPMSHPLPTVRAAEIGQWSHSEQYGKLLRGEYEPVPTPERPRLEKCPHCCADLSGAETNCPRCGNMVVSMGDFYRSRADDYLKDTLGQAAKSMGETVNKAFEDVWGYFSAGKEHKDDTGAAQAAVQRICTACGAINEADARFCKNCGAQLQ